MFRGIISTWQNLPNYINPIALRLGFLEIRWYGIMYMLSFLVSYMMLSYIITRKRVDITKSLLDDYFFWMVPAVLLGARIGYVLFYNLDYYLKNPLEIILPFDFKQGIRFVGISGLSYHGGLMGLVMGSWFFCYKKKIDFWSLADLVSLAIPLGYSLGRIGNFLNLELYGRPTGSFWGMYFPNDPRGLLRHPSQLYEAFFEGIVLFLILRFIETKTKIRGVIFSFYLLTYGFLRFMIEFFREPDIQLGFIWGPFTMGQVLCFFMILIGTFLLGFFYRRKKFYV